MIKWVVAGTTSYPKYLNTWHLPLKAFCSKFLIKATQNHNLVSARFFKSDNKKLCCLILNNTDSHGTDTMFKVYFETEFNDKVSNKSRIFSSLAPLFDHPLYDVDLPPPA